MERDAKGRFVKKGSTVKATKAKATKAAKTTKKAATETSYKVATDKLPDEIKKLIADMEANGFTCIDVGAINLCDKCSDKQEEIAAEVDKIFRSMDISTGADAPDDILYGFGACVRPSKGKKEDAFSSKVVESLRRAKEKLNNKATAATKVEDTEGTPMQWDIAEPMWIKDLHEIYAEGSIPETEEDMRQEIVSILGDTAKVILGFMCYLEAKEAVKAEHTCKCKGKCKGRK